MKKAIEQIKKLRGNHAVSNPVVDTINIIDNVIFWTDFDIFYKKEIDFNFNKSFSISLKDTVNKFKNIKKVEKVEIKDNILIINDFDKIVIYDEFTPLPETLYDSDLLNNKIVENLNTKDLKEFIKGAACEQYNILSCVNLKKDKIAVTNGNILNILNLKNNIEDKKQYNLKVDVLKSLNCDTFNLYVNQDKKYLTVENEKELITIVNYDGNYPEYEQLIPHYENKITVNNKDLKKFLKKIKPYINRRTNVLKFDFENKKVYCLNDYQTAEFNNNVFNFDFNIMSSIGLNFGYLLLACDFMKNDFDVYYSNFSNLSVVYIKSDNKEFLLMPIQIRTTAAKNEIINKTETTETTETETEEKIEELNKINSEFIKAEAAEEEEEEEKEEKTEKTYTHINYITGALYSGHNTEILDNAMKKYNYVDSAWLGSYQAKKAKLQLKKENIHPISIFVYVENKNTGEMFKKYENIYNIADFEAITKIEDLEEFKNIVDELRKIS